MKILIILFLFNTIVLNKAWAFTLSPIYKNGTTVCEENIGLRNGEISYWVNVPIDYKDLSKGETQIYAYTKRPIDYTLPSVIFFTGGPGSSARSMEFTLPNVNIIFFEQRGISCSRPKTETLFLDFHFYSSENTARDAREILKYLHINHATAYGHSYGTIPATIFSSFFKDQTDSLILEGVIYHGDESLWSSSIKKNLLQNFFNSLSLDVQNKIIELSNSNLVPNNWFSKVGSMMLYLNNGISTFSDFLNSLLNMDSETFNVFINNFFPHEKMEEEFSFGDVMMGMIGCQEISMNDPNLSLTMTFNDRTLQYDRKNIDKKERCDRLILPKNTQPYMAEKYPVNVPVTYFLGENDGATDLNQGLLHSRNVAQNNRNILILKQGGHLPVLTLLSENRDCNPDEEADKCQSLEQNKMMVKIVQDIIQFKKVKLINIENFNSKGPLHFSVEVRDEN
jgi:proline iminopeptidase